MQAASIQAHEKVVEVLVQNIADVNFQAVLW